MTGPLYKVCTETAYAEAAAQGCFQGSADDIRDGFIHLSAAHQLEGTLRKHFAGRSGLILLAVDPVRLGNALKWEVSRDGALFPHLYAPLDLAAVLSVTPLPLADDGTHSIPAEVLA